MTPEAIAAFLSEYEELLNKHQLCIQATGLGDMYVRPTTGPEDVEDQLLTLELSSRVRTT